MTTATFTAMEKLSSASRAKEAVITDCRLPSPDPLPLLPYLASLLLIHLLLPSCAAPCAQTQPNAAGYAPGWCGFHVTQYQKNEGPDASTGGTSEYRFDIKIFDANHNQIGGVDKADAPGGQAVGVDSKLPYVIEVMAGNVDDDLVTFAYAYQNWAYAVSFYPGG